MCLSLNVYSQHISEHHYFNGDGGGAYLDKMRRFDDKTALWFGAACDTISMDSAPFLFHSSTPPSFYPFSNSTQAYFVLLDSAQIPKIKLHFSAKKNIRPISMEESQNGDFLLTYMISDDTVYLNGNVFISDTLIKKGALCLTKVSWDGNIVFTRYFPCGAALSAHIATFPNGDIAIAGHVNYQDIIFDIFTLHCLGCHVEDTDIFTALLDSMGNTIKARRFGSTQYDYCNDLVATPDGDLYLTGTTLGDFHCDSLFFDNYLGWFSGDAFLLKLDSAMNGIWLMQAGSASEESGRVLTQDAEGNIYWGGFFWGNEVFVAGDTLSGTYTNTFIVKVDAEGQILWKKVFASEGPLQNISALSTDASNNIWAAMSYYVSLTFGSDSLAGGVTAPDGINSDAALVQINPEGNILQCYAANSVCGESFAGVQPLPGNRLFVSGGVDIDETDSFQFLNMTLYDWENHTGPDFYFTLDLPVVSTEVLPDAMGKAVLAPNPVQAGHFFQVMCEVEFQEGHAMLYDHLGHLIRQTALPRAGKQFFLPAPPYAGIYYLVVQTGNQRITKKIAVTR